MSVAYCCIVCDLLPQRTMFCVNVATRAAFEQFHDANIEYDAMADCAACKDDGYGRIRVCMAACTRLADDSERQMFKDKRVAALRDTWVAFLRHCAEHGSGYRVSY